MSIRPDHPMTAQAPRRLCVAPMMAWTDRHCRYLHRLAAPHALLFTEMITSGALRHGPAERLLRFHSSEHPVALQLGGSDPGELAEAAAAGAAAGFDEINLNVGCPSPRVRQGRFGACLMREPALVAHCVRRMASAARVPVTVKCRLGVDDDDSEAFLERFVAEAAAAGCETFYVHARKALLNGLSPAENRTVPPLDYERVYRLKARHPELEIVINGGIDTVGALDRHLAAVDGVMIGRAAYQQPMLLAAMDRHLFGAPADAASERVPDPTIVVMSGYRRYMAHELDRGTRLADMTRHCLGLFAGRPGARQFRRALSDARRLKANDLTLVDEALAALGDEVPARAA
ncbi:MAG TPA: tRNA dihydrouridine(20/20a) synthase DusA [Pseudomonadales bacterium]